MTGPCPPRGAALGFAGVPDHARDPHERREALDGFQVVFLATARRLLGADGLALIMTLQALLA